MVMKKITDILEKLRVDDIVFSEKFPIDGTIDDIIEFLKNQGFEDIDERGSKDKVFNSKESKCFSCLEELQRIWFADTSKGKISKSNPIFVIRFFEDIKKVSSYSYSLYYLNNNRDVEFIVRDDKEDFLKELNKRFGWE